MRKQGGIQLLEKAVQAAIYEKALKNHYIEILYIDFEDTHALCIFSGVFATPSMIPST